MPNLSFRPLFDLRPGAATLPCPSLRHWFRPTQLKKVKINGCFVNIVISFLGISSEEKGVARKNERLCPFFTKTEHSSSSLGSCDLREKQQNVLQLAYI